MDENKIQALYEELHTPAHIRKHCEGVAKVSVFIARKLNEKGISVDIGKLKAAALLHDAVRICDIHNWPPQDLYKEADIEDITVWENLREKYRGMHHADAIAEILKEIGESELARIIQKHKFKQILEAEPFGSWEQKILYYADKRVNHHEIVDLHHRLCEGKARNAPNDEDNSEKVFALEEEICKAAGIAPDDINGLSQNT